MRGKGEFLSELNGSVGQAEDNVQHLFSSSELLGETSSPQLKVKSGMSRKKGEGGVGGELVNTW